MAYRLRPLLPCLRTPCRRPRLTASLSITSNDPKSTIIRDSYHPNYTDPDSSYVKFTREMIEMAIQREPQLWNECLVTLKRIQSTASALQKNIKSPGGSPSCPRAAAAGFVRTEHEEPSEMLDKTFFRLNAASELLQRLIPDMLNDPLPPASLWDPKRVVSDNEDVAEQAMNIDRMRNQLQALFKKQTAAALALESATSRYIKDRDVDALTERLEQAVDFYFSSDSDDKSSPTVISGPQWMPGQSNDSWDDEDDWEPALDLPMSSSDDPVRT